MFNAATPPPPDPYWQKWTQSGNALSRQCQHEAAQAAYLEARTIAESLLPTAAQAENPHAIHLYVISCHNLSDSFLCQGQTTEAELMLLKAHRMASQIMSDSTLPPTFRIEGMNALKLVLMQVVDFYQRLNQPSADEDLYHRSVSQMIQFLSEMRNNAADS
jgi:hypothetical protein